MILYLIGASLTAGLLLTAFLKDGSTPKSDIYSWTVILVGFLLWFICFPLMMRKRFIEILRALTPAPQS